MPTTYKDSLQVVFVSSWQEGEVRTLARLNPKTGEIHDIEVSEVGEDYEHLIEEYIESLDGTSWAQVVRNESDGEYQLARKASLAMFASSVRGS